MNFHSNRLFVLGAGAAVLLAALVCNPAYADVLEIQDSGAVWIAGGRSAVRPSNPGSAELVGEVFAIPQFTPSPTGSDIIISGPAQWRSHLVAVAEKYDLSPALFEALVWQESRWNQHAVSPVGARGLAQLMPDTARELGVDPADPLQNLEGGARYLRMLLNKFGGNVDVALAAYNAGPSRVERAGGIPNIRETREYVAAIMARLAQPVRR